MSAGGSLKVIIGSLVANLGIAAAKGVAAAITGSGSMLAESIHSAADCMNQILLLVGAKQAEQPPDESHPLGYGRSAYFWSFLVALMIFFGGGVLSIREGIHKIIHPDPVEHVWIAIAVLAVSLVLEAGAAYQAASAINAKRGEVPFFAYLRATTDVDLVVLFAENTAAVIGLVFAMSALGLAVATGDPHWDGYGSAVIGILLTAVAFFLGREVKSLLEGERADPAIETAFREEAAKQPCVEKVVRVITLQQGPSQVIVAAKLDVKKGVPSEELIASFNAIEAAVKARLPEVKWQFLEPDNVDLSVDFSLLAEPDSAAKKTTNLTLSMQATKSPVVLFHSGGMSGRQWRKLAEDLGQTHRVLTPDFLGSGDQPLLPEGERFHFSQDVDRMQQLLVELGEPVHLVGHSYGGFVALMLAKRSTIELRSLCAYDPVAFGVLTAANDEEGLRDLSQVAANPAFSNAAAGGDDAWLEAFVDYWNGAGSWRGMPEPARAAFLRVGRTVYWEVTTLMEEKTGAEAYDDLDVPALFVTGDRSPAAAGRVVQLLANELPHGRKLVVEGAGHMGPITHGPLFNAAVIAHITQAEAQR